MDQQTEVLALFEQHDVSRYIRFLRSSYRNYAHELDSVFDLRSFSSRSSVTCW
jgi:hypothetical protein